MDTGAGPYISYLKSPNPFTEGTEANTEAERAYKMCPGLTLMS